MKKKNKLTNGKCITFHSDNLDADNTVDNPNVVLPKESSVNIEGNVFNAEIGAKTFAIYKFTKE